MGVDRGDSLAGVIPRAAAALFQHLGASQLDNRNSLSGLRAPKRYSTMSTPAAPKGKEPDWIMKATYVEVRSPPAYPSLRSGLGQGRCRR